MGEKELSKTEEKILKHIALKGPKTEYEIFGKDKIASNSTVWKTDRKLRSLGFIEVKKEESFRIAGITKNYLGLTFKGLHYCLLRGLVSAKDAHQKVMTKHEIKLPSLPGKSKIEKDAKFRELCSSMSYHELPKVAKEFIGLFPLDFFSGLKNLDFHECKTEEEYRGLIYINIFQKLSLFAYFNNKRQKMMESKYVREYILKIAERQYRDLQQFLKEEGVRP